MRVITIYSEFAYYYDRLMGDVDYAQWADYLVRIFERFNCKPKLVADLGCGTGSFCLEMDRRGYEMIGIDASAEMLSCARQKALDSGSEILFLNQDITEFELYGTVDVITCLMDSLNYITYKNDLRRMIKWVHNYLNPKGLFVFDINSPYKFENVLASNVFYEPSDDVSYIWQNSYDRRSEVCRFDLTFFVKEGGLYRRFDEVHYERSYAVGELTEILGNAGMKVLGIYSAFSFKKPGPKSERIFFVCERQG